MDQYLVYGNPIEQSKSPTIHTSFAKECKQSMVYNKKLAEVDNFKQEVMNFIEAGGKGANVTAPFKEQAMSMCDELSEHAKFSGAVNTLTFKNGKIYGDTTDGVGLVRDLLEHDVKLSGSKVLLLGAGGASKGVVLPLLDQNVKKLTIANRTVSKAQDIANQYPQKPISACSFEEANKQGFDIIINATSAGLSGNGLPISESIITPETICYDMTYGKTMTPFLKKATSLKAKQVIDGLGMLVGQAAESFYIWRGVKPSTSKVLTQLRNELAK